MSNIVGLENIKIILNLSDFSEDVITQIKKLIGDKYTLSLTGKEKSELTEKRMRKVINENRPKNTDYDFNCGEGYFFEKDRVELKQFYVKGSSPKIQQVKPELYDKIIVCAEDDDETTWYLLYTNKISKLAGKKNKEGNKLTLCSQHKGNLKEGQISYNSQFKKESIYITTTKKLDYKKEDLGLSDKTILEILEFTKNH